MAAGLTGIVALSALLLSLLASRVGLMRYLFGGSGAERKPFVMVAAAGTGDAVSVKIGDEMGISFPNARDGGNV